MIDGFRIVVIGRNEGQRLLDCLDSLAGYEDRMIYVDSGSTDASVTEAKERGVQVVSLDTGTPFTAARARQEGYEALQSIGEEFEVVQFFDGDCRVIDGYLSDAIEALQQDPKLGIVTGWRSEISRSASIYNALCDFEWHRPAGDIATCGGDMMVRAVAFENAGGFNPNVIAAEDDEFCVRVRKLGWGIRRIPSDMTLHDAAMHYFSQWWNRAIRSGHGFAQVGDLHPRYFVKERRRVWVYGFWLPLFALLGTLFSTWAIWVVVGVYLISYIRTVFGLTKDGLPTDEARRHAVFLSLSKFPNFIGIVTYFWRKLRGLNNTIIEYK